MRRPRVKPASPQEAATDRLATGSNAPVEILGTVEERIGREIRKFRGRIGLTGAELARAASISTGMLSKIETGQISPSLGTLESIAGVLNIPLAALFTVSDTRRDCSFVKRGQGVVIDRRGTKVGHQYQLLGHTLAGDFSVEPYLITLSPEAAPYTGFQHAGLELIYMLTGRVCYRHDDRRYVLEPGDTLFFDATATHGPEELLELPMTYLSIIIYPRP